MADSKLPQDPFEMFRRLWGPLGLPVPGMAMPTLDPQEIEKRIADLRSIEGWLTLNLNMVRLSISGLDMQKTALEALRSAGTLPGGMTGPAVAPTGPGETASADAAAHAMLWPWTVLQQAMHSGASAATAAKESQNENATRPPAADAPE